MSKTKGKRYSAEFKTKVALEAMKEEKTTAELAMKFGIHHSQVADWKWQAVEGLTDVFTDKTERNDIAHEVQIEELHDKIGHLTVERDFIGNSTILSKS